MSAVPSTAVGFTRTTRLHRDFKLTAVAGGAVIIAVLAYTSVSDPTSALSETFGVLSGFGFVLFATFACARGARRGNTYSRAWFYLTFALLLCSASSAITIVYSLTREGGYPFPTISDYAYLAYVVPSVAALLAMPRPSELRISRWRLVLDALVIALGVWFLSWVSVLEPVISSVGLDDVAGRTMAAFPVVDILICSAVLTLGMRQPPGERLTWWLLGGGLVALAVTDSVYVRLINDGTPNLGTHPLIFGWMIAPLLVALATMVVPGSQPPVRKAAPVSFGLEFIPYLPVIAAVIVIAVHGADRNAFLVVSGTLLGICLLTRQAMIIRENLSLTRNLTRKVTELARLGSIVTSSHDAIIGISVDGLITSCNPAAERLFGIKAVDVLGSEPAFISPAEQQGLGETIAQTERGEWVASYETQWSRPDGTTVEIALAISPIMYRGVFQGVSVSGQDITERKRVAASLVQAREDALESSRLKSEFLATMSHEIRTPMNGVIGLAELLLETPLDQVQRQYAEGVNTAGEALLAVLNDVLDFSKLEAGKVELELVDFSLGKLVDEVGSLVAPSAAQKGIELLAYCRPGVPDTWRGDPGRIRQILLNLASNAVKFTVAGEVAIRVGVIGLETDAQRLRFEVSDTGIGIDAEGRTLLFQAFSQVDASTTRRYGGTGLGLAISSRLVEAMRGAIGVSSQPGQGSTFWFELPLARADALEPAPLTRGLDLLAGKRVIVVDDNATSRQIVAAHLTTWRAYPDTAHDARTALSLMRAKAAEGTPYDIAVLDMSLPDVDGLELAATISGDEALRPTRMVLLTPTLLFNTTMIERAGISEWLAKPVRGSELYDRLQRVAGPPTDRPTSGPAPVAHPDPRPAPGDHTIGRILVVEDNSLNQLVAEGIVSRLGYQVNIVANGQQALAALGSTSYAAVLMDCHMPIMDGFDATREIRRRQDQNRTIPIIAMTAAAMEEDRERCLAAGMDDYVSKPIDLQTVGELLRKWVRTDPSPDLEARIDGSRLDQLRQLGSFQDTDVLSAVVDLFIRQAPGDLAAIREAVRVGAVSDLKAATHGLRGAADNVGATRVAGLCLELDLCDPDEQGEAARIVHQLRIELRLACHALELALLTAPGGPVQPL
jgi:two-component system sensor histidine kinase/response regulator